MSKSKEQASKDCKCKCTNTTNRVTLKIADDDADVAAARKVAA